MYIFSISKIDKFYNSKLIKILKIHRADCLFCSKKFEYDNTILNIIIFYKTFSYLLNGIFEI